jgi:hypothetical protein
VRTELESVLSNGVIDRQANLGRLLTYICDKYVRGEQDDLREYNIALDVFGRSVDFDKRRDSIVRVEASRLRRKLREYYEGPGRDHSLQIELPAGTYIPHFVSLDQAPPPAVHILYTMRRKWWVAVLALFVTGAAGAGVAVWRRVQAPTPQTRQESAVVPASNGAADGIRVLAGYKKDRYIDRLGHVWLGDRYFRGGAGMAATPGFIHRAPDSTPFQTFRGLGEFWYDIPAPPGRYEVRLHFAETEIGPDSLSGGADGSRVMSLTLNGAKLIPKLDVLSDAGGSNIAMVRVLRDVGPAADGKIHLGFHIWAGFPFVNAIEVLPLPSSGATRPLRVVARETSYTDNAGQLWEPDTYFLGGRLVLRKKSAAGTDDPDLYIGERYGRFSYALPAAPGRYRLTLHFAETWYCGVPECSGGAGERIFDVYANGAALIRNLDIFREAGGGFKALQKTFHNLEPNAQGNILLNFEPVKDYACVNAIELMDETSREH